VIATGVDARRLSVSAPEHCFVVRHADETSALLERVGAVGEGGVAVVIGGGFIGAEVATSLTARGLRVIVLEAQARPLVGPLGDTVAQWLEGLAGAAGIELRVNQRVDDVLDVDGRAHVLTGDGEIVADVIVMGVGAVATTGWLEGSGLVIDNGVVVDEELAAAPGVFVIGDLARFPLTTSLGVDHVRIEHWQVANDHAAQLAAYLTGQASPPAMIPYFWSDQYGKKIQVLGHPAPSDDVRLVSGSLEEAKWLALYSRGDVITGVVALSQPRALMVSKVLLETPHSVVDALALAPWAN
jgi:NADPH-dependent 2,4-dienoyl-CoA reductase/sulfur reductase-like enzyme